jgi:hypothetical protein
MHEARVLAVPAFVKLLKLRDSAVSPLPFAAQRSRHSRWRKDLDLLFLQLAHTAACGATLDLTHFSLASDDCPSHRVH